MICSANMISCGKSWKELGSTVEKWKRNATSFRKKTICSGNNYPIPTCTTTKAKASSYNYPN
jgi:hypothetical protein